MWKYLVSIVFYLFLKNIVFIVLLDVGLCT